LYSISRAFFRCWYEYKPSPLPDSSPTTSAGPPLLLRKMKHLMLGSVDVVDGIYVVLSLCALSSVLPARVKRRRFLIALYVSLVRACFLTSAFLGGMIVSLFMWAFRRSNIPIKYTPFLFFASARILRSRSLSCPVALFVSPVKDRSSRVSIPPSSLAPLRLRAGISFY